MERGFKASCERYASDARTELGLGVEAPLPASSLAEHLGVVLLAPRDVPHMSEMHLHTLLVNDPSSWSAATLEVEGRVFVVHNSTHALTRQESDVMHELAHIVRMHRPSQLVRLESLGMLLRTYDAQQESEATWFGACLQLPRPALNWAVRVGMKDDEIGRHFTASLRQVRFRRGVSGVDIQHKRYKVAARR